MSRDTKLVLVIIILAVAVGYLWASSQGTHPAAAVDPQLQRLALEGARKAQTMSLVFRLAMLSLIFLATAGICYQLVSWLSKKANTIYPDQKTGLFPIVRLSVGGHQAIHDQNRSPTTATIYTRGRQGDVRGVQVLPADCTAAQPPLTTGTARAHHHVAAATPMTLNAQSRQLVENVVTPSPVRPALPEVKILNIEPSHVERLLEDHGDDP